VAAYYNNRFGYNLTEQLLDSTFLGTCDSANELLLTNSGGTLVLELRQPLSGQLSSSLPLSSHNANFPGKVVVSEYFILVYSGTNWHIISAELKLLKSGTTASPIWDAVPFGFMGHEGFLLATGGSATNLTQGAAAGGSLEYVSVALQIQLKAYNNSAPTALLKDGTNILVGITYSNSLSIAYELYDDSIKLCDAGSFVTSISGVAFASFYARSGKVYALVTGTLGASYSPKLIDLELNQEITLQSTNLTSLTNWRPTVKRLLCELPIFDFGTTQTGAAFTIDKFWSVNGEAPISSTYQPSTRLLALTYSSLGFRTVPLMLKSSGAFEISAVGLSQGQLLVQTAGQVRRLTLITTHNQVLPNVRFVRIQTQRPYQIPFIETEGAISAGTCDIYLQGTRYTFTPVNTLATGYKTLGIWDIIRRNGQVYGIEMFSEDGGQGIASLRSRFILPTAVAASALFPGQARYDGQIATRRTAQTFGGTQYFYFNNEDKFNVELAHRDLMLTANQSWFRDTWHTRNLCAFDVGIVLWQENFVAGSPNRFTEVYLPSVEVSAVEFFSDISADNCTITLSRYDARNKAESLITALGTSDFEDVFEPNTNAQIDILSFGNNFLTWLDTAAVRGANSAFGQGIGKVFSGYINSVKSVDSQSEAASSGMLEMLGTPYKDVTGLLCPYAFGGVKCAKALTKSFGLVTSSSGNYIIVDFGTTLPLAVDFYLQGTVRFLNAGFQSVEKDVSSINLVTGTQYRINFFNSFNFSQPKPGTLIVLANGCTKTLKRCDEYNNLPRGRHMPYLQGARVYSASGEINNGVIPP
jgi:hypothetical protein